MILTLFINQITPNFHTIYKEDHLSLLEKEIEKKEKKIGQYCQGF
jgi:hypothetical protein